MTGKNVSTHEQWSGSPAFILAAAGSAVGLGNIWKFPYITGENGGGAFVLVYLLCIALIGAPIMMAEILLGRRAQRNPINALGFLAAEANVSQSWRLLGWLGVLTGFLILSFYSVVAGWALAYVLKAAAGGFAGIGPEESADRFGRLLGNPWQLLGWHTLFMLLCYGFVAKGVRRGIEVAVRWMMPLLFLLLVVLVLYAAWLGQFGEGLAFMFRADFGALTREAVLIALGHAFFTLSLGMGAIMAYGSYLPPQVSIARTTLVIVLADTTVALLAGLAIFPIVFATGLEPQAGPGLMFQTLPYVFGHMPAGSVFAFLFFLLVVFAALTSGISLLEPATAYLVQRLGWARAKAAALLTAGIWLLGLLSVLSFNAWSDVHPLGVGPLRDMTFFDLLDGLTTNFLLPLGGMGIAIFAGWRMSRSATMQELRFGPVAHAVWRFVVRYISPVLVALVLLNGIGVLG
jgi:NSS family neurotransmitter:Na+ symporter